MYMCIKGINFAFFYDFNLELVRQCGIFCCCYLRCSYNLLMTGYSPKYKYSQTCLKGHLYIAKHYL